MVEVGPGLGSLTVALADTGAHVVAVEVDPGLEAALREVTASLDTVRLVVGDALRVDWSELLGRESRPWSMVANLPYNVAVPVLVRALESEPRIERFLVMVQREVGERLAARPGDPEYGAVSVRVAYRADARVVRPVARTVFWPQPNVDSVLVSLDRRPPPVTVDEADLWAVVRTGFGQRRKTLRGALTRLGLDRAQAEAVLAACGVAALARAEELGLEELACVAREWRARRG